jgi:hypothetical protein
MQAIISLWLSEDRALDARMVVATTSYEEGRAFRRIRQYWVLLTPIEALERLTQASFSFTSWEVIGRLLLRHACVSWIHKLKIVVLLVASP